MKFIFKKNKLYINTKDLTLRPIGETACFGPLGMIDLNPSSCKESERYPVSKKCCKSYKEGKACKKCPRYRDWNYLMSWKPVQLEPQNDGRGEWLKGSLSSCETQLRGSRRLMQYPLPVLESV